jgi:para-nitrobenzyl esterase
MGFEPAWVWDFKSPAYPMKTTPSQMERRVSPARWSLVLAVLLAGGLFSASQLGAALKEPVRVQEGLLAGVPAIDPSITAFKGIPFAAPPVGNLRWKAPQAAAKWEGIRPADKFGPSPIQRSVVESKPWTHEFMTHGDLSEDCLYLNVWTPAKAPAEKLPVFVWIYGGGYTEGSGAVDVYNGEGLARKGLVTVTINYRVGAFGFLAHPELTAESGYNASGNYGILDTVAALKWVQANIAAFGGDPGNVTIAGQSAGSGITQVLLLSPLGKGLFHRAILESGPALGVGTSRLADQEAAGVAFGAARGAHSLAEMRALTSQQIFRAPAAPAPAPTPAAAPAAGTTAAAAAPAARGGRGGVRSGPFIDGYVLTAPAAEIFAAGKHNDVPVIGGGNARDSGALGSMPVTLQWAATRNAMSRTPSYAYYFTHVLPGPDSAKDGAFHTSEVPYALNTLFMSDRPFTDADHKVAAMMSQYWANFAKTGNPNGPGLPRWLNTAEAGGQVMELGDNMGMIDPPGPAVPAAPATPAPTPAAR